MWLDLDHADEHGMALLPELFATRTTDIADCDTRTPVPKLHLYTDHHYTAINGLSRGGNGQLYFQPLKVFQNPHLVVTVLGQPVRRCHATRPAASSTPSTAATTATPSAPRPRSS